jgi:hypothetical protein
MGSSESFLAAPDPVSFAIAGSTILDQHRREDVPVAALPCENKKYKLLVVLLCDAYVSNAHACACMYVRAFASVYVCVWPFSCVAVYVSMYVRM